MGPFEKLVEKLTESDVTDRLLSGINALPHGSQYMFLQAAKPGASLSAAESKILSRIPDQGFDLGFVSQALVYSSNLRRLVSTKMEHTALIKLFRRGLLRVEHITSPETYLILKTGLQERKYDQVGPATVYLDPTMDELLACCRRGRARGFIDGQHVYIWKESEASHGYIANKMEIVKGIPFYVDREFDDFIISPSEWSGGSEADIPKIERHPKIKRMIGNRPVMAMAFA